MDLDGWAPEEHSQREQVDAVPASGEAEVIAFPAAVGDGSDALGLHRFEQSYEHITCGLSDLFGPSFVVSTTNPPDPMLVDTRSLLRRLFGPYICEEDVDIGDQSNEKLASEMKKNHTLVEVEKVTRLFGSSGTSIVMRQQPRLFACLHSTMPQKQSLGVHQELWLTDMPKITPNRQTLHMEPQPFAPSSFSKPKSTERKLYTPQNVVRWAHHHATDTFMSNARVVRWSDGSVTLHVGSDLFTLQQSKDNSLTMLASPVVVGKDDLKTQAMVSVLTPDEHYVVEGASAASIEKAVTEESLRLRSISAQHNLAYTVSTLPAIDWNKKTNTGRTSIEEYVMLEYNRRQKIIEQRKKEGRPMTLTEQMEMENELLQKLQTLSDRELLEEFGEQRRREALRTTTRQQHTRKSRFDRNLNLEGGDYSVDNSGFDVLEMSSENASNNDRDDVNNSEYGEVENSYEAFLRNKRQREESEEDAARVHRFRQH
ncbi:putative Leo1 like protein [Trypanosoma vivax]|uniref:Leo1-like protein n=1 Tax=Trypanosoma vivax (strain Y486) TaxID=1055687 RepID=G0U3F4_TRYVY|nr:hypothetical protein TRVL_00529 [Trypanosoma vivax]KAH8613979.1 putative Leo1 like protein [Trypanosoma vivax]CCC50811.1 conserved hypothetical protein [Trypanosoma vivax Y486]